MSRRAKEPPAPDAGAALDVALRELRDIINQRGWTAAYVAVYADGAVEVRCSGNGYPRVAYLAGLSELSAYPLPSVRLAQLRDDAEAARARGFR